MDEHSTAQRRSGPPDRRGTEEMEAELGLPPITDEDPAPPGALPPQLEDRLVRASLDAYHGAQLQRPGGMRRRAWLATAAALAAAGVVVGLFARQPTGGAVAYELQLPGDDRVMGAQEPAAEEVAALTADSQLRVTLRPRAALAAEAAAAQQVRTFVRGPLPGEAAPRPLELPWRRHAQGTFTLEQPLSQIPVLRPGAAGAARWELLFSIGAAASLPDAAGLAAQLSHPQRRPPYQLLRKTIEVRGAL